MEVNMEMLTFSSISKLAEYMMNRVADKEFIVATLFFDKAIELMRCLIGYKEIHIGSIDISDFEYTGYLDEYYISLTDDYTLCIEPALANNKYLRTDASLMLIDGDAKHSIVDTNCDSECIEIEFNDKYSVFEDLDSLFTYLNSLLNSEIEKPLFMIGNNFE